MTHIRVATDSDREDIRDILLSAFPEGERETVATLAVNLLNEETTPETISLLAEVDGVMVGHIAFSPVAVSQNENWKGYILAPLAVKPEYQKRQIGSELIASGIRRLNKMGVNMLFVYGDPKYYSKFGFRADLASEFLPPYELEYPFGWQAMPLTAGRLVESAVKIACVDSLNHAELW